MELLQKSYTTTMYQLCWLRRQDDQQFYSMSNIEIDKKLFLTWTWQFSTSFPSQLHVVLESLGNLWFVLVCNLLKGLVIYLVCVDPWGVHVSEKQVTCCDVKYSNWKPSVRSFIWAVHLGLKHSHTKLNLLSTDGRSSESQNISQIGM